MLRASLLFSILLCICHGANVKIPKKTQDYLTGLTILEQPCTTMRSGLVRYIPVSHKLEVCSNRQWVPYDPVSPRSRLGLVGHWKMDEQTGDTVDDDSGHENHATASG
ncbi:uncharacterized protein LOC116297960, partial [Actinia tenebrosa]|uniref:Uncharacterized protein LOC116297960 n=1 Tax=Actinia tenebrosa TaxID=6105 RepID=A0A6P8I2U3_ACTTE